MNAPTAELLFYDIALSLLPAIGPVLARSLVSHCGSPELVFRARKSELTRIPGIGLRIAGQIISQDIYRKAEEELEFISRNKIRVYSYLDQEYPKRLKHCVDAPVVLYSKGNADLNHHRIISVVGTRKATDYGRGLCAELLSELAVYDPLVVSGLAYGIDIAAHKEALKNGLATLGVLGHGLDKLYPAGHTSIARQMMEQGGLLTEYTSGTRPDRENFPARNRIIAGLADATLVVEAWESGGALITADIANSYNRDVMAFPGRVRDVSSGGCNRLIRQHKAHMITCASDLVQLLSWDEEERSSAGRQQKLWEELTSEEKKIATIMQQNACIAIDELALRSHYNMSKLAAVLLQMEMKGMIRALPGKVYELS